MVNRGWQFLLDVTFIPVLVLMCSNSYAVEPMKAEEPVFKPEVARKDVKIAKIDSESFEIGYFAGSLAFEDFGTNSTHGLFITFHVNEDVFLLGNYGFTKVGESSREKAYGDLSLTEEQRDVTYYNVLLGYNLFPGEVFIGNKLAFNSDLYFVIGSGTTQFASNDYATFVYGWGYRFLANDWLSIQLDIKNYTFTHYIFGYEKRVSNLESTFGLSIFF